MKLSLFIFFILVFASTFAQSYDKIKGFLAINQLEKAEEEFKKASEKEKFLLKPEAFILKSTIYTNMAIGQNMFGKPQSLGLLNTGDEAFDKYKSMDAKMDLAFSDPVYANTAINLYSGYFKCAYADYEAKNWNNALDVFQKTEKYSNLLKTSGILKGTIDTNLVLLIGFASESVGNRANAVKYYKQIADLKLRGDGYESIYRFLVSNSFGQNNLADFEKYKQIGKEIYPKSDYFSYDKVDFATGLDNDFINRREKLKKILSTDSENERANYTLGQIIFDTLYTKGSGGDKKPSNAEELEKEMLEALKIVTKVNPKNELAFVILGNHFINKSVPIEESLTSFIRELAKKYKPKAPYSKEDQDKRNVLEKNYGTLINQAKPFYESAAALYAAKAKLENKEKAQYRSVIGFLSEIATVNKTANIANKELAAKYDVEIDKWDEIKAAIKF